MTKLQVQFDSSENGQSRVIEEKMLTARQLDVLRWLYYGKTNPEIGKLLGIDALTVKNHVQAIIRRLEVEDRTRAVTVALERGIISMEPMKVPAPREELPEHPLARHFDKKKER